jgi:fatty-acyl-CoA synthase
MLASAQAGAVVVAAPAFEDWLADAARIAETPLTIRPDEAPDDASQALPPILPDQTSYLQFSSGSTRFPTGVVVTHRALMANAVAIARHGL